MYFCKYEEIQDKIYEKDKILSEMSSPKTFIVELFPYYMNKNTGNIAKYARGKDYHIVVQDKLLKKIAEYKKQYPENKFMSFCDISPLPEVYIAYKSGAGILGKNHLIFDDKYGGYVFIGIILTDLVIKFDPKPLKNCINCGKCIKACPYGAINPQGVDTKKCLSNLTQQNKDLTDTDKIKNADYIWGCDICLDVCPMNKNPKQTEILEFKTNLIYNLQLEDVKNLTRKQFCEKFHQRAFTFKGPNPIKRNLMVKINENP